ncbi:nuclear pore complex protein DDB_G0274915-like [Triplophysa dalaica]|uniref:nuclear pore complex protein DDB_G0274915-like n=2 Tax=cellular organisms TaxID=131567 RepID=UPI0024DFD244|nr:nuclear pore complex protein DDB_G0274915-like [Triplophysa dalaica]
MSEIDNSEMENNDFFADQGPSENSTAHQRTSTGQEAVTGKRTETPRGRQPSRTVRHTPKRRSNTASSSPPSRASAASSASSYTSAQRSIPEMRKWTVVTLRQALENADIPFSKKATKAELNHLYTSSLPGVLTTAPTSKLKAADKTCSTTILQHQESSTPTAARKRRRSPSKQGRHSASLSHAPDHADTSTQPAAGSPESSTSDDSTPVHHHHGGASTRPPAATLPTLSHYPPSHFPSGLWPAAPMPSDTARLPPAQAQAQTFFNFPIATGSGAAQSVMLHPYAAPAAAPLFHNTLSYPSHWPAATLPIDNARLPPLQAQAQVQASSPFPIASGSGAAQSVMLHPYAAPAAAPLFPHTTSRAAFTIHSATPIAIPPNAPAWEPPPVASNITDQILAEVQAASFRSSPTPHPSTSLFVTNIPLGHPLKPLLDVSLSHIILSVSPRTLQSYLTAWKCFKSFHAKFILTFPDFSMLAITSFISHLNTSKNLQASSIKGYLSGLQFFHKLIFGSPSPQIASSQTSMLIKGIQRGHPSRPDPRKPITLEILTKCIITLRQGYHSTHTARTLDAMFLLAFFGFLRCSELTITSKFNPDIHPTISDLSVMDDDTISYFIKQSKTDQTKRGHLIYIFNLPSALQPYQTLQAYLQLRSTQTLNPSDPLFVDDFNRHTTRFWFQKHLKLVLIQSGIPADNFSSHSFRIGAATTAAQKGLSQHQIQTLGRWSSEAFKSYIRSDRSHIKEAHRTLINQNR